MKSAGSSRIDTEGEEMTSATRQITDGITTTRTKEDGKAMMAVKTLVIILQNTTNNRSPLFQINSTLSHALTQRQIDKNRGLIKHPVNNRMLNARRSLMTELTT